MAPVRQNATTIRAPRTGHQYGDPPQAPATSPPATRVALVASGAALFLLGLLAFVMFQTQVMFTDNVRLSQISPGLVPRNDGGILFGAMLTGLGTSLMLFSVSPLPIRRRVVPAAVVVLSVASLLWTHFTIFVNAFLVPRARSVDLRASFLFHDTANALPIATFVLAALTLTLVVILLLAGLVLVAPDAWGRRMLRPRTLDEHRTRLALTALFLGGIGAAFARQFFSYALHGDSHPSGGILNANVTVVYYLLAFAVVLALGLMAWRTYLLTWRDVRDTRSISFGRAYTYLTTTETWIWGIMLVLNGVLLLAGPTYQPDASVDRVFAMNSRGVSVFFFLVMGLYVLHRAFSRAQMDHLRQHDAPSRVRPWDPLARMASLAVALWVVAALALWFTDLTPLTKLLVRVAAVAVVLPFFAVRFDSSQFGRPLLRNEGSAYILLASTALSILAGIMLWGVGNSVVTRYVETGGFVATVQPYATGVRVLGSLFLALPITLCLWFLATRFRPRVHPGPLLVAAFSIIIGMNLLLTINAADPRDPSIGRTDVLVGFSVISTTTVIDKVVILGIWIATAAMGFLATALLVHHGTQRPKTTEPDGPLYA